MTETTYNTLPRRRIFKNLIKMPNFMYHEYDDNNNKCMLIEKIENIDSNIQTLNVNVVTCVEAATAKNIPLANELKSLLLKTDKGLYLLHLRGDRSADLRSIKKFLGVKEAYIAGKEDLDFLGTERGTINPFSDKLRALPQLVSEDLRYMQFLSTNYGGCLNKYIVFTPSVLFEVLHGSNVKIGNFTKKEDVKKWRT